MTAKDVISVIFIGVSTLCTVAVLGFLFGLAFFVVYALTVGV